MNLFNITFKNPEEILEFSKKVEKYPYPMDLKCGSIMIDAKSLIGLLDLGCNRVVTLIVHADECEELHCDIDKFIAA